MATAESVIGSESAPGPDGPGPTPSAWLSDPGDGQSLGAVRERGSDR